MNNLNIIMKFFNAGVAEKEGTFLNNVYVPFNDLEKIVNFNDQEIKIIVGNKGSGKSALLNYLLSENNCNGIPTLLFKPDDLNIYAFKDQTTISEVKALIYEKLLFEIAARVGKDLAKFITEDEKPLLQAAEEKGYKDKDIVRKILNMFGKSIVKADLTEYFKNKGSNSYYKALENYNHFQNKLFFLLFDDIDQIASRDNNNFYYVIWGFILAISKIAEVFTNVKPIIALRTEIWRGLNQIDPKNDQIDHLIPMTYYLNPSEKDLKEILNKRLQHCLNKLDSKEGYDDVYSPFFEGKHCILPKRRYITYTPTELEEDNDVQKRLWETYLITSSRYRPRDTVNLVSMLAKSAINNKRGKISNQDVLNTAYDYSKERVTVLCQENSDRTNKLEGIINFFSKGEFENDFTGLKDLLKRYLSSGELLLDDKKIYDNDQGLREFIDFLCDIEFLFVRDADINAKSFYKHIRPLDAPNLIKSATINELQKYMWDVHQSYRSYLEAVREQDKERIEVKRLAKKKNKKGMRR